MTSRLPSFSLQSIQQNIRLRRLQLGSASSFTKKITWHPCQQANSHSGIRRGVEWPTESIIYKAGPRGAVVQEQDRQMIKSTMTSSSRTITTPPRPLRLETKKVAGMKSF